MALLAGCSSPPPRSGALDDIRVLSADAIVLPVAFEGQSTPNLCGVSALEMLTRYHGVLLRKGITEELRSQATAAEGLQAGALEDALTQAGYDVALFTGALGEETNGLTRQLRLGRPVIVLLGLGEEGPGHYVLVTGFDPVRSLIVVLDPRRGLLAVPEAEFDRKWSEMRRLTLLAVPGTVPAAGTTGVAEAK